MTHTGSARYGTTRATSRAIGTTILAVLAVQALAGLAIMYFGVFNVAATDPHWGITRAILDTARVRSIKSQASGIKPPENLADHRRVVAGTSHFAEHCSSCHSAPGVEADEIAKGMYPPPPVLKDASRQWSSGELFWIIRHGIKMSGMPAWPDHNDEDIWNIVAFLGQLPGLSEDDYGALVKEAIEAGGHATHRNQPSDQDCSPEHRAAGHC
jgi:mono/diheme cytochrome c family protein